MPREFLWWLGFWIFYTLKHPKIAPLRALRALTRKKKTEQSQVLLHEAKSRDVAVTKKIWMYWAQGWEDAPILIKLCRDSWIRHNPGWEVVQLSLQNVNEYMQLPYSLEGKEVPYPAYSDIVRMRLLSVYGGVWADATTFCSAPLDTWLPSVMQSGFFAFEKPKTTIASWFLAAEKGNVLVERWDQYVTRYWKYVRKPGRYFWLHYLFEYVLTRDPVAREIWKQTPKMSSLGPYAARDCLKQEADQKVCVDLLFDRSVFVHKLDWKMGITDAFVEDARDRMVQQH